MESINQILRDSANQIRSTLRQLEPGSFIQSLPSVLIEDEEVYRQLPVDVSAVYFLTHPIEELLYVGKTNNLQTRWRPTGHTHEYLQPAIRLGQVTLAWWVLDADISSIVEEILIGTWGPSWNGGVTGWIRMYRPDLEWPDNIDNESIESSERQRGLTVTRIEQARKIMRQQTWRWS